MENFIQTNVNAFGFPKIKKVYQVGFFLIYQISSELYSHQKKERKEKKSEFYWSLKLFLKK